MLWNARQQQQAGVQADDYRFFDIDIQIRSTLDKTKEVRPCFAGGVTSRGYDFVARSYKNARQDSGIRVGVRAQAPAFVFVPFHFDSPPSVVSLRLHAMDESEFEQIAYAIVTEYL